MRLALPLLLLAGCSVTSFEDRGCTEIGCENGVRVEFQFRDKGSYIVEATVDGLKTTCRAVIPLSDPPPEACDRQGVFLTLSGSKLPPEQQTIGGLFLSTTTGKQILLKVTRDGVVLGTLDRTIDYTVTPGPNGPACEPKECRAAKLTL